MNDNPSISIRDNTGDVMGVGIDGNGNIICKNSIIYQVKRDFNLTYLSKEYLTRHHNTEEDFNNWLKGFSLSLPSIYQKRHFERKEVLAHIENMLKDKNRLLLLGESGTSKSTLLMEIMCDYLEKDYKVLYSFGNEELKNEDGITETLEGLLKSKNKVMVVVDNIHDKKTSLIFHILSNLSTLAEIEKKNIHFLLAARTPEFNWLIENGQLEDIRLLQLVDSFFTKEYQYDVPPFLEKEIYQFLQKYEDYLHTSLKSKQLKDVAQTIYTETNGHPIMVKFYCFLDGLLTHVKSMYHSHLIDKDNPQNKPNTKRIQAVIAAALIDISSLELTDELAIKLGVQDSLIELDNTMIKELDGTWKTIHPKWDLELLKYMFSLKVRSNIQIIRESFSYAVYTLLDNSNYRLTLLNTIYHTITKQDIIKKDIIEKTINLVDVENKLDDLSKPLFYSKVIGPFYDDIGRYAEAIVEFDKALKIDSNYVGAYYNKGNSLSNLGRDEDAIREYNKALKIDSNYVGAYNNKGVSLSKLGKYEEAIVEYDKALKIDSNPVGAYNNKGNSFSKLDRDEEAIVEYDKALKINPNDVNAYYNKGLSLFKLGRYAEAIVEFDKALKIDSNNVDALLVKSISLFLLGKKNEAKQEVNKALEIEPDNQLAQQIKEGFEK